MNGIFGLRKLSAELVDLHNIMALLQWDQEVQIPARADGNRASQIGTLSTLIHQKEVSDKLGKVIKQVEKQQKKLNDIDRGLVRVMRRAYDQNTKLPEAFVSEFAKLTSKALQIWVKARKQSDFSLFEPILEKLVVMSRQKAEYLGYAKEAYDALLDLHEEGLTTEQVEMMFENLRQPLVELLQDISRTEQKQLVVDPPLPLAAQKLFADRVLAKIGFDFERGRQDQSAHPFTTSLGHHDRRVTNRYRPDSVEFIFSALHEGGHALYEQGIDEDLAQTHLDAGVSLGIHESQSRLWENIIGRSLEFWQHFYPELQEAFPDQFKGLSVQEFVPAVNGVRPGLIRVEADEVSYNLHVLIRFEIEKELFRGTIKVADLPAIWNSKYLEYLGVTVDSAANGVLQDIHWSHGSFGYFPTYSIGNLAAAQIWQAYCKFDPDHKNTMASGNLSKIRAWLTKQIYRHGSVYQPNKLLHQITGEDLNPAYFLSYLSEKYKQLV